MSGAGVRGARAGTRGPDKTRTSFASLLDLATSVRENTGKHVSRIPTMKTLRDLLTTGALEPAHAAALLRECCRGIAETRDLGIVTPRNVFLVSARLSLVERIDPLRIGEIGAAEDLAYLSPELANGATEVTTSDVVFSLGAIFAEMLSGVSLFRRATDYETILAICADRQFNPLHFPSAPEQLHRVMVRALAPAASERYASVGDLASAVHEAEAKVSPYR